MTRKGFIRRLIAISLCFNLMALPTGGARTAERRRGEQGNDARRSQHHRDLKSGKSKSKSKSQNIFYARQNEGDVVYSGKKGKSKKGQKIDVSANEMAEDNSNQNHNEDYPKGDPYNDYPNNHGDKPEKQPVPKPTPQPTSYPTKSPPPIIALVKEYQKLRRSTKPPTTVPAVEPPTSAPIRPAEPPTNPTTGEPNITFGENSLNATTGRSNQTLGGGHGIIIEGNSTNLTIGGGHAVIIEGNSTIGGNTTITGIPTIDENLTTESNATTKGNSTSESNTTMGGNSTIEPPKGGTSTPERNSTSEGGNSTIVGNVTVGVISLEQDSIVANNSAPDNKNKTNIAIGVPAASQTTNGSDSAARESVKPGSEGIPNKEDRQSGVDCKLNSNGIFGEITGSIYEVKYIYQVYVYSNTSLARLRYEVMPDLDAAIAEGILPYFFDCKQTTRTRHLQSSTIQAVSSRQPDEVVLEGLNCSGIIPSGANCYIAEGSITVLGTGFSSLAGVNALVLPAIQLTMQSGELTKANPSVYGVTALGDDLSTLAPLQTKEPVSSPVPGAPTTPSQPSSGPPTVGQVPTTTPIPGPPTATPVPGVPTATTPSATTPSATVPSAAQTTAPTVSPTFSSRTVFPTKPSGLPPASSPTGGNNSTLAPTGQTPTGQTPTSAPGETKTAETQKWSDQIKWWQWLLFVVCFVILVACCVSLLKTPKGGPARNDVVAPTGIGNPNNVYKPKKSQDAVDIDPYVPPGGDSKTDAPIGSFTITPNVPATFSNSAVLPQRIDEEEGEDDTENDEKREEEGEEETDDGKNDNIEEVEDDEEEDEEIQYYEDNNEGDEHVDMEYGVQEVDMEYGDQGTGYGTGTESDEHFEKEEEEQYETEEEQEQFVDEEFETDAEEEFEGEEEEEYEEQEESYYEEESEPEDHHAITGWENQYSVGGSK